ncbi:MAG: hypothetical protein E5X05_01470 [Mesorhizobium sp.]|nr:MAG: hypothetical protein E5X05_01470 [Mesorhizobium sp.]
MEAAIKSLEWRNGYRDESVTIFQASFGGIYQVRILESGIWLDWPDREASQFPGVEAAKAAAQADFEQCILHAVGERSTMDRITSELAANLMKPALDAAARRLVHTLEEFDRTQVQPLEAALKAIIKRPHGCTYCDYGELRKPPKFPHSNPSNTHDNDCGYFMAESCLSS